MTGYIETRSHSNPWLIRLPILMVIGVVTLVAALMVFVAAVQMRYGSTVMPGVYVNGVDLSGMTRAQVTVALADHFDYPQRAVFTFRHEDDDRFWQFSAGDLGVALDAGATADAALAAGHTGNLLADLIEQGSIWFAGRSIAPVVRYDQNAALERLTSVANEIDRPAQNATLDINGILISTAPSVIGQTVDVQATLNELNNAILRLDTGGEISLAIKEDLPLVVDVEVAAARAWAAVSEPVTIIADGPDGQPLGPWTIMPNQIGDLLTKTAVTNADGTMSYQVEVNVGVFRSFLENLAPSLSTEATDGRFHFNDDTHQLEVFESAVNGRKLNVADTLDRLEAAIFNADPNAKQVPVAFDYVLPKYHNNITAAELGISGLISQATTYYTGSTANRIQNVIESARRFDGVIVAPGEEFSYLDTLGNITPEDGFVEGFVIVGGRTVKGVGGGVCQVSTTAFQAAFYAGYPITERWAHGYRVGYYERGEGVGMDASVYQGDAALGERSLDLKFVNDTPYHLLIETSIFPGEDAIQFRFYSTNPGRQVIKRGPTIQNVVPAKPTTYEMNPNLSAGQERWIDWPAEGAYVEVTRVILDTNGDEIDSTKFRTQYQPWGAIVEVAPGDPRLTSTS